MQRIFVIGAGKSSTVLIKYLLDQAEEQDWMVTVGDLSLELAQSKVGDHPRGHAITFNVKDEESRHAAIKQCDLVVSLLPANMHNPVARDCIQYQKHFVSASYVSPEMHKLHEKATQAGVILLNECGLDPGIDHMSAMRMIKEVEDKGARITCFESYAGGLIDPDSDNNPWHYKLTWNPRNIVLSGQGITKFYWKDTLKVIPYSRLFQRYDILTIPGYGDYEGYPNRDSTRYKKFYGLKDAHTVVRGTLRKRGYCDAWNMLVQLGVTDESYKVNFSANATWKEFVDCFLPYDPDMDTREKFINYFDLHGRDEIMDKLDWLGLFSDRKVGSGKQSPARVLQDLIEDKWKLDPGDKDLIVMLHKMEFEHEEVEYEAQMSLAVAGEDELRTGMAKTVGLPLGIAAKLILTGKVESRGVVIPVTEDLYTPILNELEQDHQISFVHELKEMSNG